MARLLVTRLDLAREMLVDDEVVRRTGNRAAYADALLAFTRADVTGRHTFANFIRPRHRGARITALSTEDSMSRRSLFLSTVAILTVVVATAAAAVTAVPLPGPTGTVAAGSALQEEVLQLGDGVTPPRVTHEVKADYTEAALDALARPVAGQQAR